MEDQELNPSLPPCLHLISAFFAMEPNGCLISLARECGNGSITKAVQSLIWEHCINNAMSKENAPSKLYVKNFLKKLIVEVESSGDYVLDGLYEQFAHYITSIKDDILAKCSTRVCKTFSFIFPDDCVEVPNCPKSMKIEVPLRCSLNMFEGDTGCSIWPASLYLSEFILSYPEIFTAKSCFEVGSGVGLVGICLALVKASEVILTDGDMSTLANLKLNLELNRLGAENQTLPGIYQGSNTVKCKYLSWELASESELQVFKPDLVLGADVLYDPLCFPHLIRVLAILLNPKTFNAGPVAYMATVIRNVDTYNYFLSLASQSHLFILDITPTHKPLNLLPYMQSYDRSNIRLFTISIMS